MENFDFSTLLDRGSGVWFSEVLWVMTSEEPTLYIYLVSNRQPVLNPPPGLEEALVRAEERSSHRRARRPAVLQEPALPPADQVHQPEPVRAGNPTEPLRSSGPVLYCLTVWSPPGGRRPVVHQEGAGEQLRVRPADRGADLVPGGRVRGGHEPLGVVHLPALRLQPDRRRYR